MALSDDLAAAQAARPKPILVDIAIGDSLYKVEVRRLDGMQWAGVIASAPPVDEMSVRLGYQPSKAALTACSMYSRLLDADGSPVTSMGVDENGEPLPVDWSAIFAAISGVEIQAIAATWWGLNNNDPNKNVLALKKASQGGSKMK